MRQGALRIESAGDSLITRLQKLIQAVKAGRMNPAVTKNRNMPAKREEENKKVYACGDS